MSFDNLISFSDNCWVVNEKTLDNLVKHLTPGRPVAFLSESTCNYHGKSLIYAFIRYLKVCTSTICFSTPMGDIASWLSSKETEYCVESNVAGVYIWNESFIISKGNISFYLLVLKLQSVPSLGYDFEIAVNRLIAQLSSYQIINIHCNSITDCIHKLVSKAPGRTQPSQILDFLIRDYKAFPNTQDICACVVHGRLFLESIKDDMTYQQLRTIRQVNSFCLPDSSEMENDFFKKMISVYVEMVIQSINPLCINEDELKSDFLKEFIIQVCNKQSSPIVLNQLQQTLRVHNQAELCILKTKQQLWDYFYFVRTYIDPLKLNSLYEKRKAEMIESFNKVCPIENDYTVYERNRMLNEIEHYFDMIKKKNATIKPYLSASPRRNGLCRRKSQVRPILSDVPPRPE